MFLRPKIILNPKMLDDFLQERKIRRALKAIARQRVAMVLQPGNFQVIERSPPREEWFELGARTALIRGWAEVLHENLPTGQVSLQGNTAALPKYMSPETHYKLTDGGWAVLNRSQAWMFATFLVSTISLAVSIAALIVTCC